LGVGIRRAFAPSPQILKSALLETSATDVLRELGTRVRLRSRDTENANLEPSPVFARRPKRSRSAGVSIIERVRAMSWWGTAVGGTVGMLFGGPVGAVVGAALGRTVDRAADRLNPFAHAHADSALLKRRFFESTFAVMGHLAKADGRVSELEIAFARSVMERMGLDGEMRRTAIDLFNLGKTPEFDLGASLAELRRTVHGQSPLLQLFLEIQLGAAYADGEPGPAERATLERIRALLQIPVASYRRLEQLIQLQFRILGAFGGRGGAGGWTGARSGTQESPAGTLAGAYATLGVEPGASDAEVKSAYRRLLNRHHPDKLASRGLPEEAIKMASKKAQEIIRAYETITQARGR
jgi:DnaJ like chaperone protein